MPPSTHASKIHLFIDNLWGGGSRQQRTGVDLHGTHEAGLLGVLIVSEIVPIAPHRVSIENKNLVNIDYFCFGHEICDNTIPINSNPIQYHPHLQQHTQCSTHTRGPMYRFTLRLRSSHRALTFRREEFLGARWMSMPLVAGRG